jgi:selenide, water dikinase
MVTPLLTACTCCSGMLPGYVAGHYTHDECHIDLSKLARFAQARLVHGTCTSIDVKSRQLGISGRPPLRYDCLSVDIGITPDLQSVPGLDSVTPVKPIDGYSNPPHQFSLLLTISDVSIQD